jgi:hypothetical protein
MTIAVGWRDGDNVFLIADSSLTFHGGGRPVLSRSVVGEAQREGPNRVEESIAKVIQVSETTIATFAGFTTPALDALNLLGKFLARRVPFRDALLAVSQAFESAPNFTLLVAGEFENRRELWRVTPSDPERLLTEVYEDRVPVVVGSLPSDGVAFVRDAVLEIYSVPLVAKDPDRVLASVIMLFQAYGQRVDLIAAYAGGTFFGMRLGPEGVAFQKDLLYVFLATYPVRQDGYPGPLVFSCIREGALIAYSTIINEYKVLAHTQTDGQIARIMNHLTIHRFKKRRPLGAHYYGFIAANTGAFVQVRSDSRRPSRWLRIFGEALFLTPRLGALLLRSSPDKRPPAEGGGQARFH